jgi:dihydrofolate reductase
MRGRPAVCHGLGTGRGPVDNSRSLEPPPTLANTMQVRELVEAAPPVMWNEPGDPLRVIGGLTLVRRLFRLGHVDRFRLMVFPRSSG